ncbi:hypothetical protein E2K69_19100, partial [Escherichia coli]
SANTLWLLRYKPEDIPVLRDNFNVPEFMLKRFLKMPEGPAPDDKQTGKHCHKGGHGHRLPGNPFRNA